MAVFTEAEAKITELDTRVPYLYCAVTNTGTAGTYVVGCTLV